MPYKIGEFAKKVSLSVDTLRFYEKEKLLTPARNVNNIRLYTEQDIKWVEFIKRLKATGMPLREIKLYAKLRQQGNSTIPIRIEMLEQQKINTAAKIHDYELNLIFLEQKISFYHSLQKAT